MSIDWFTFIAQLLNFGILIWILKRFLYQPILKTMIERQQAIRQSITEAEVEKDRASAEREQLESERLEMTQKRERELQLAHDDAQSERERFLLKARDEFDKARAHWTESLNREQGEFQEELSEQVRSEVVAISDQVLAALADADLETLVVRKFLRTVKEIDTEQVRQLRAALQNGSLPAATVRSAFELAPDMKERVRNAVCEILGSNTSVEFETKPSLGCGIEMSVDGQKVAWTIEGYLQSLKAAISGLIAKPAQ